MTGDLEAEREEQTELVDDDSEAHQRASEQARAAREADRDTDRDDDQLDLDTAAGTQRLDAYEDEEDDDG